MTAREKLLTIDEHGADLTTWETKFISDMLSRTARLNTFTTPKQDAIIDRILRQRVPERWQ